MTVTHITAEYEAFTPAGAAPTANRVPTGHIDGLPAPTPRDIIPSAYFGRFGGQEVPNLLLSALDELEVIYVEATADPEFHVELDRLRHTYLGHETPIYKCMNLSIEGDAWIVLRCEDLVHGGAYKGNNVFRQVLSVKRMGKKRLIAETRIGQHGTTIAMVATLMGMECTIYMDAHGVERQQPNAARMKLMDASVIPVTRGNAGLKDAIDIALEEWGTHPKDTLYLLGSATGPYPFSPIVRRFQSVIPEESRAQSLSEFGRLPDVVIATVGGGSNAIGTPVHCLEDEGIKLIGARPIDKDLDSGEHGASIYAGRVDSLYGMYSFVVMDDKDDLLPSHSTSAGLDHPSVGSEHVMLAETGRARYVGVTDDEVLDAFKVLFRFEGIIPVVESSRAIAQALEMAWELAVSQESDEDVPLLLMNLSGHGDKDMGRIADRLWILGAPRGLLPRRESPQLFLIRRNDPRLFPSYEGSLELSSYPRGGEHSLTSASLCRRVLLMTRVKATTADPRRETLQVLLMHEGEGGSI